MLDTSDEFKFEFEKVICTNLLKRDHKNKLTVHELMFEKLGFIWQGMKDKIDQTKKPVWAIRASELWTPKKNDTAGI